MLLRAAIILMTMFVCGCDYKPDERLLGAWEGREADGSRMIMVFEKEGKLTVAAGAERGEGTYVVHEKTAPLQLDLHFKLGETQIVGKSIFVFLSANQIKLSQPMPKRAADFGSKVLIMNRRVQ
jgi:hypothetical protein